MNPYRVPKRRQEAELVLAGGAVHRVAVFLADQVKGHGGRERLSDLLNAPGDFIPTENLQTGKPVFFRRAAIAMVKAPLDRAPYDPVELTLPNEHDVDIELIDGSVIAGLLTYVNPTDRSRLIDFLEDTPLFFQITDADTMYLLNKGHVVSVAPSER